MSKHTSGPWEVKPDEPGNTYLRVRGSQLGCRFRIANVLKLTYDGAPESEDKETQANANLISAAPEMLDFLKEVAAGPYSDSDFGSLLQTFKVRARTIINAIEQSE